jgi:hypothetical protein
LKRLAAHHLGRERPDRALAAAEVLQVELLAKRLELRQAKVGHLAVEVLVDEQIRQLEVAVHNRRLAAVQPEHAERGVAREPEARNQRERLRVVAKEQRLDTLLHQLGDNHVGARRAVALHGGEARSALAHDDAAAAAAGDNATAGAPRHFKAPHLIAHVDKRDASGGDERRGIAEHAKADGGAGANQAMSGYLDKPGSITGGIGIDDTEHFVVGRDGEREGRVGVAKGDAATRGARQEQRTKRNIEANGIEHRIEIGHRRARHIVSAGGETAQRQDVVVSDGKAAAAEEQNRIGMDDARHDGDLVANRRHGALVDVLVAQHFHRASHVAARASEHAAKCAVSDFLFQPQLARVDLGWAGRWTP